MLNKFCFIKLRIGIVHNITKIFPCYLVHRIDTLKVFERKSLSWIHFNATYSHKPGISQICIVFFRARDIIVDNTIFKNRLHGKEEMFYPMLLGEMECKIVV